MTTPLPSRPPRSTDRRTTAPCIAVPREPLDPARTGRRWVRRRARGMTAAALDVARFAARQNSRHEDLAVAERGPAELGEWERIALLLADAAPGTVYGPDTDDVVRAELAADAAAAAAREAELREAMRIAARADELQALRELLALDQAEPRSGDEAVRDELTRRAGGYIPANVDACLARALAVHLGHYRDPAAREAAAGLLTPPVLAHAALLAELVRLVPDAGVEQLAFAARLVITDPEAAGDLAAFLTRARPRGMRASPSAHPQGPGTSGESWGFGCQRCTI
ncbi:hypothetical protein [Streptomyces sp. CA-256286]|uniref:hypothetical protein n=1 Tax=Streptomyces sp. CA-256286 TaxID=2801033 RepID=UPI001BB53C9B|nr:hypothetical protein [Streptomyces sp. CA-256286]QTA36741.1 hypothetical protein JHY03_69570 [Streptomyces sp. CA-256286]